MRKKNEFDRRKFVTGTIAGLVAGAGNLSAQEAPGPGKSLPFSGQTALVTGGARGIGRAAALDLARAGANIVIFDILENIKSVRYELSTKKDLEETLKLIRAEGVMASGYKVDVRDESEVQQGFEKALREYKKIDIVVACAGIVTLGSVTDMSETNWKDVIDVNLTGMFNTIQTASRHMKESNYGRIIAISSMASKIPRPWTISYTASKWGVVGLVKAAAQELAPHNITCNVINPSFVNTDMVKQVIESGSLPKGVTELAPAEIARVISFLAHKDSGHITERRMTWPR